MNCYHCDSELMWGGDALIDHEDDEFQMETHLYCSNKECNAEYLVYLPKDKDE